jgi:hypothetical protein
LWLKLSMKVKQICFRRKVLNIVMYSWWFHKKNWTLLCITHFWCTNSGHDEQTERNGEINLYL